MHASSDLHQVDLTSSQRGYNGADIEANNEGDIEAPPRLRISSLRRPTDGGSSDHQPITAVGWPPGDHRLLPENCLSESHEVRVSVPTVALVGIPHIVFDV